MVVVVEGLHPSVARLDGEAAGDALGGEQLVPVCKEKPSNFRGRRGTSYKIFFLRGFTKHRLHVFVLDFA